MMTGPPVEMRSGECVKTRRLLISARLKTLSAPCSMNGRLARREHLEPILVEIVDIDT